MSKLYTDLGTDTMRGRGCEYQVHIVSCNACSAHTLDGDPNSIKHNDNCGGMKEVKK